MKKRINKWAARSQTTNNGDKIFCDAIARGIRQTRWREDDLEDEVERELNTGQAENNYHDTKT